MRQAKWRRRLRFGAAADCRTTTAAAAATKRKRLSSFPRDFRLAAAKEERWEQVVKMEPDPRGVATRFLNCVSLVLLFFVAGTSDHSPSLSLSPRHIQRETARESHSERNPSQRHSLFHQGFPRARGSSYLNATEADDARGGVGAFAALDLLEPTGEDLLFEIRAAGPIQLLFLV